MPHELLTTCSECGAQIVFDAGEYVVTCEYCSTKNARPKSSGEELAALKRGNELRANCEFEEALKCYEYVLRKYPEEHEALWGKLLCKYGVETVEERRFGRVKRYHLCHRVRKTALRNEGDYKRACELAPEEVRVRYEETAEYIDNVQAKVRAKVEGREGYEVFICYKETEPGTEQSTPDGKIARALYLRYQQAGYKVFFAPYTLGSKYGEDYEAEIYLALKTASVMIVLGTKPEYMNATWPKSEWSRYLEFMPENGGLLIPVFSGMTAADLPEELRNLGIQGCNMDHNFNYQEDIEKALFTRLRKAAEEPAPAPAGNPLFRRALIFLQNGEFARADEYFEKVLDAEPENAAAYMGKLCVERKVAAEAALAEQAQELTGSNNYKNALAFADEAQKRVYEGYNEAIRKRIEEARLQAAYNDALNAMNNAKLIPALIDAEEKFRAMSGYRDSAELAQDCRRKIDLYLKKSMFGGIAAGSFYTVGVKKDGTVVATGDNRKGQCNVGEWTDIVAVASGVYHTVGLRADQTVIAAGDNVFDECNVGDWYGIVSVAAGSGHTVGLRRDATVAATGNNAFGQCNVYGWEEIIAIAAGDHHTLGLKADGTVMATGWNNKGACNVSRWKDIVSIAAGTSHTVGLKSDGTVVVVGDNSKHQQNVRAWKDIVAIAAAGEYTVGLKADGTVVAAGENTFGQCNVNGWRDVVYVAAGGNHTLGLKEDGTVVATGGNAFGQCNVKGWRGLVLPLWEHGELTSTCVVCGAQIVFPANEDAAECPFCASKNRIGRRNPAKEHGELTSTCVMCGAQIVFPANEDIVECRFCGRKNQRP